MHIKSLCTRIIVFVLIFSLTVPLSITLSKPVFAEAEVQPDVIDTAVQDEVSMIRGELMTLKTYDLTRISISNPGVADIVKAEVNELLIIGKAVGQTAFFLWDSKGKRTVVVRVVDEDLYLIKRRVEKLIEIAGVEGVSLEVNAAESKVVATGELEAKEYAAVRSILSRFGDHILNMVKKKVIEDLVQINVQISELNTTLQKSLGFDWTTGSNDSLIFTVPETLPTTGANSDSYDRILKIGNFSRTSALLATVDMLHKEGKARTLSKPRLVVVSGKEANFQVGGQVPIRTTSTGSGGTEISENVSYRDYGIIMSITPTIREGKIDITLSVEISDIDASNAVGDDVAFTTRSAQTQLFLDDGQTIVLAGLIKSAKSTTYDKVPFLGDIPIIGMAFRKKSNPSADTDTEVVIALTPKILARSDSEEKMQKDEPAKEAGATKDLLEEEDGIEDTVERIDKLLETASKWEKVEDLEQEEEDLLSGKEDDMMEESQEDIAAGQAGLASARQEEHGTEMADEAEDDLAKRAAEEALVEERKEEGEMLPGEMMKERQEDTAAGQAGLASARQEEHGTEMADEVEEDLAKRAAEKALVEERKEEGEMLPGEMMKERQEDTAAGQAGLASARQEEHGTEMADEVEEDLAKRAAEKALVEERKEEGEMLPGEMMGEAEDLAEEDAHLTEKDKELLVKMQNEEVTGTKDFLASDEGFVESQYVAKGDISDTIAAYVQTVQKRISDAISYPYEAAEKGWQGTVKVTLRILKDGSLDEATIKESSGYEIFDKDALNTAQILAPFSAFPPDLDLEEIVITIPIVYSQDAAALDVACPINYVPMKKQALFIPSGKTYAQVVKERIADSAMYPRKAKESGWEGTATLSLNIRRDGTLAYAELKESSGNELIDKCALVTAKKLAPYSEFPADSDLQEINITIPIDYSLEKK